MNSKTLTSIARKHAKEQLGTEQFKTNKPAVQAISEDFEAGAKQVVGLVLAGLLDEGQYLQTGLYQEGRNDERAFWNQNIRAAAESLGLDLDEIAV